MNPAMADRDIAIANSLKKCAPMVWQVGCGRWNFALSNGAPLEATARREEGWLLLEARLGTGVAPEMVWKLLEWNTQLEGMSKFVLLPDRSTQVRAEIPLDDEVELAARLNESCAGFKAAAECWRGEKTEEPKESAASIRAVDSALGTMSDLPRLCQESGWTFTERAVGKLAVGLDVPGGFYQAVLEEYGHRGVQISVELGRCEAFSVPSCQALGVFLLTAAAIVRLARAAVEQRDGRTIPRFEVRFATLPGAGELSHSLSALSVACRLCGREVKALGDEATAKEYLSVRGWPS